MLPLLWVAVVVELVHQVQMLQVAALVAVVEMVLQTQ
jgi:hypothetical protein